MRRSKLSRRLRPLIDRLESRSLPSSSAQYIGLSHTDLNNNPVAYFDAAGPTAALGPGGYSNLDIRLTLPLGPNNQAPTLDYVSMAGPPGFAWYYGNPAQRFFNPQANARITAADPVINTQETFELNFSPVVQYVNPNTGAQSTLSLSGNVQFSLTVQYETSSGTVVDTLVVNATNLTPPLAYPTPSLPSLSFATYPGTFASQTSDGKAHIIVPNLPDMTTVNKSELSDVAGLYTGIWVALVAGASWG